MDRRPSFNELIGTTFSLMSGDLAVILCVIAALTIGATYTDIAAPMAGLAIGIAALVAEYYLLRRLIDRYELRSADRFAGFGSFFILGLITGLGIALGFVLLIVPGIYLSARWSMAGPALLAENEGSGEAMRRSADATRDHILPIALVWALIALPLVAGALLINGLGTMVANAEGNGGTIVALDAVFNALIYVSQVTSWYFGVAIYQLLAAPAETQLGPVFA
ncbi:MAG: hypothetical protein ACTHJR_09155 [Sphingomonas sp.]|uniref:hypothetical protein n=1 Tax=Sphingomonas sp. TaxID=28214 RepID=UPI003F81B651